MNKIGLELSSSLAIERAAPSGKLNSLKVRLIDLAPDDLRLNFQVEMLSVLGQVPGLTG